MTDESFEKAIQWFEKINKLTPEDFQSKEQFMSKYCYTSHQISISDKAVSLYLYGKIEISRSHETSDVILIQCAAGNIACHAPESKIIVNQYDVTGNERQESKCEN